jgi:hypothetical protein
MVAPATVKTFLMLDGYNVLCFVLDNVWNSDVHGFNGMFFAFSTFALGGVPEQVLQGRWIYV